MGFCKQFFREQQLYSSHAFSRKYLLTYFFDVTLQSNYKH